MCKAWKEPVEHAQTTLSKQHLGRKNMHLIHRNVCFKRATKSTRETCPPPAKLARATGKKVSLQPLYMLLLTFLHMDLLQPLQLRDFIKIRIKFIFGMEDPNPQIWGNFLTIASSHLFSSSNTDQTDGTEYLHNLTTIRRMPSYIPFGTPKQLSNI